MWEAVIVGVFKGLYYVLDQLAKKQSTADNAQTDSGLLARWRDSVGERLRH